METDNLLMIVAIVAVVVAVIGAGITYNSVTTFKQWMTGFATTTGEINLTVEESISINFTTDSIEWGSGRVDDGETSATLNTAAGATNVSQGNWTGNTAGLVVENIGNKDISINLTFGDDADTLLGGTSAINSYQINATDNQGTACTGGVVSAGQFIDADTTTRLVCANFSFVDSKDELRFDFKLVIPSDSKTGYISDTVTASIQAA